jgi:seryl-tRNA synthetase
LDVAQSYKISIEMFAPSLQNFVEVGHLATYDDYLSKRLMLKFEEENIEKKDKALKSLFVVSGTAINITKVIACIIEQTNGKLMK